LIHFNEKPRGLILPGFFLNDKTMRRLSVTGKKVRFIVLSIVLLLLLSAVTVWVYQEWPDPPINEIQAANQALMSARDAEAAKYCPTQFKNTCRLYELAMNNWKKENERFILNRDFTRTKAFAHQAAKSGKEAYKKAIEKAFIIHQNTGMTLVELEKIKKNFEKVYSPLPLQNAVRDNFNKAILLISEAKLARERSDLPLAEAKLEKAKYLMESSDNKARTMLKNYFDSLHKWRSQVKNAIEQSAIQHSTLLIVKKMEHECLLYQNGQLKDKFEVEFGPNWIGDKTCRGDRATPEGIYRVVHKKDHRKTIYHKALAINYPNDEDRILYSNNVASGNISRRRDMGGSIEIHGGGGRGFNWTNGCIALTDKDIDIVFEMVSENTPVVIVGSLEPLEKYTN
jgi:L,D-peptidoglycan transpeptidase YkuD (ErfK/YbiS/YcfS/YnhG family)